MNCQIIKELILTDYSDGQLTPKKKIQVDNHLNHCLSCRALAQRVRQTIAPLTNSPQLEVPAALWSRIKDKIVEEQPQAVMEAAPGLIETLRHFIYMFRPAVAAGCLMLVLATGLFVYNNLSTQEPYLTYVMGGDTQSNDEVSTGIEEYFL
jgi:anti-sigma factor RsiW